MLKTSNTLKQFASNSRQIALVCLTILRDWHLKGSYFMFHFLGKRITTGSICFFRV